VLVGLAGWLLPTQSHWTALIPAGFGVALMLASAARVVSRARVAAGLGAAVAVLVLIGAGSALGALPELLRGEAGVPTKARAGAAAIALAMLVGLTACRPWRR
jgi:hypothetical protein